MSNQQKPQLLTRDYVIAGLKVRMIIRSGWTTEVQARDYLCDFEGEPDIIFGLPDEYIQEKHEKYPHLTVADCEYMWTADYFCRRLIEFGGFMLHASAVVFEGRAYLFSAPSGTGKSTHTQLWRKVFGEENTYILNDDKPAIRIEKGEIMVYGTPWSGKTDQNKNIGVPLQGVCFLERGAENQIQQIDTASALFNVLNQTIRPSDEGSMSALLEVLDGFLEKARVYKMRCNMNDDAPRVSYEGMSQG